jgi:4-amino-4-deoxy-L-arabinose transferase-like glycosyltransferase
MAAALLLLSSPLLWFHGEVALSYMIEAVFVTLVAFLCYRHLTGQDDRIWLSALMLGIAGGFRQNTMVFLLPLWAVSAWRFRWRRAISAGIVLALSCAAWLLPMMALTGGAERYWEAVGAASQGIAEESSLLDGKQMAINGARLVMFTWYALPAGVVPLVLGAGRWARTHLGHWRSWPRDPRGQLFFWWIAPSLVFYFFIHIRQQGHSFTFMSAVLLLTAAAIGQMLPPSPTVGTGGGHPSPPLAGGTEGGKVQKHGSQHRALYVGWTAVVVAANVLFFLAAPSALFDSPRLLFSTPSWRSIQAQDSYVIERVETIRTHFAPQRTAVLATGRSFRYPDYYLRDYQYTSLSHQRGAEAEVLSNMDILVLFDPPLLDQVSESARVSSLALSDGAALSYLNCDDGENIVVSRKKIACQR